MRSGSVRLAVAALGAVLFVPTLIVGGMATSASAAPAPLTVAFISSQTGLAAPEDLGAVGVFNAAIAAQNARGGVNGHKLVPLVIDDQTTGVVTATQEAISRGVIGIVTISSLWGSAAKYTTQAGVPVTGESSDGPEWGEQPYTNMFAADTGSVNPTYPVNTLYGKLVKQFGGTRLAVYALGVSPNSVQANSNEAQSVARVAPGASVVVNNSSVPYGGANFGPDALVAKQHNVNIMWSNLDSASNYALAGAYKQAGVRTKAIFFPSGYASNVPNSPVWPDVQGDIFQVVFHPFYLPNSGTQQMQAALVKYDHWTSRDFPSFAEDEAWLATQLMLTGLQRAGANPTHANVITSLRSIKAWNGNGLLPFTVNFSTIFGHNPSKTCVWLTKAAAHGFVPIGTSPVCGTDIPGTTSVSS